MFHIDYIGVYILLFTDIHNIYIHLSILVFFYCMGFSIIFNTANNSFILLSKSKKLFTGAYLANVSKWQGCCAGVILQKSVEGVVTVA